MKSNKYIIFLGFLLFFSSLGVIDKFLGLYGLISYLCFIVILFYLLYVSSLLKNVFLDLKIIYVLFFISLAVLFIMFMFIYPVANNHQYFGGSESDDALNIAVNNLLKFDYPYYSKTYLGNAITPMPGAVLMAIPFVLLGTSAYQNFFWIFLYILFLILYLPTKKSALYLFTILFFFTPVIPYHIFTGSDYIANSIYVLLLLYLMYYLLSENKASRASFLVSFLLGFTLSSRPNFSLLIPVIFLFLIKKLNLKTSLIHSLLIISGFLLITIPFYLFDTARFSPLHNIDKLGIFNNILPYSEIIVPLLSVTASITFLLLHKNDFNFDILLTGCFIALFVPVISGFILSSIQSGFINYRYSFYSSYFIFYAVVPLWKRIQENMFHADTADKKE